MRYLYFTIILLIITTSCKKDFEISNLNGDTITILGHGGMGIEHLYPLNSFESIQNCLSIGADGTEIDIQMTKDSVLVVFHDELLEHSTNSDGAIYLKNWDDVNDASYLFPPYAQYKVVTLDQLFSDLANPKDFTFFLDCKNFNPDTTTAYYNTFNNALIQVIEDHDLADNVVVELKRTGLIESLQAKRPDLKIFIYQGFETGIPLAIEYQLEGITLDVNTIAKEEVAEAHALGIKIAVFNTHTKQRNVDAIEKNVDIIQTDKVNHLIKLLK